MRGKYSKLAEEILLYLAVAGLVTVTAALSPYFLTNLAKRIIKERFSKKAVEEKKMLRALQRLRRNKVIIIRENRTGECTVELTDQGKRKVKAIRVENLVIPKPKQWDKKWRIIIFDIPEQGYRTGRDVLREKLQKLGFVFIQKSVWVLPWPCENEILFLGELYGITQFINIITAEKILNDIALRKRFHLL